MFLTKEHVAIQRSVHYPTHVPRLSTKRLLLKTQTVFQLLDCVTEFNYQTVLLRTELPTRQGRLM